jgi:hypothetical protein
MTYFAAGRAIISRVTVHPTNPTPATNAFDAAKGPHGIKITRPQIVAKEAS